MPQEEKAAREAAEARVAELQEQLGRASQEAAEEAERVAAQQAELRRTADMQLAEVRRSIAWLCYAATAFA